jgi:hypothetical protein
LDKAIKLRDNEVRNALGYVRQYVGNPTRLMRIVKSGFSVERQAELDKVWGRLQIEIKLAGNCYIENIAIDEKNEKGEKTGNKVQVQKVHMSEWRNAERVELLPDKTHEVCGYRYIDKKNGLEPITTISSANELEITRNLVSYDTIEKMIDGELYTRKVEVVTPTKLRPEIVLDLTLKEFEKRFKLAMQVVFPNGFEKLTKK